MKKFVSIFLALVMAMGLTTVAWADGNVAKVGETEYATIQAAIDAAEDGDTITVIADHEMDIVDGVTNSGGYYTLVNVANKTVTIDLNGCDIAVDVTNLPANTKSSMLMGVFAADTNGALTLKDGMNTGSVRLTGGQTKTAYSLVIAYDGLISIEGGSYFADHLGDGRGMVYGNVSEQSSVDSSNTTKGVNISGGTFTLGNAGTLANGSPWILATAGSNSGKHIFVSGGTFQTDINHQYWIFEVHVPEEKALKYNDDGTWTVVDAIVYVVEPEYSGKWYLHRVGYATLADAMEGAGNNRDAATSHISGNKSGFKVEYDEKNNVSVTNNSTTETYKVYNHFGEKLEARENCIAATAVELNPINPPTNVTVQYGCTTDSSSFPTQWQTSPLFTDLTSNTQYYFFARFVENGTTTIVVDETEATTLTPYVPLFTAGDGAVGAAPTQQTPAAGETFTLPEISYTKSGYIFTGWSDGTTLYQPGDTYTMPTDKDVIFVAQWKETPQNPSHTYPIYVPPVVDDTATVTAPQTFDGGIALAVSTSILSVTGSALLLRKRED